MPIKTISINNHSLHLDTAKGFIELLLAEALR